MIAKPMFSRPTLSLPPQGGGNSRPYGQSLFLNGLGSSVPSPLVGEGQGEG